MLVCSPLKSCLKFFHKMLITDVLEYSKYVSAQLLLLALLFATLLTTKCLSCYYNYARPHFVSNVC